MWTYARGRRIGFAAGLVLFCAQATLGGAATAGPYAGPPYHAGDVVAWATSVESLQRGPIDIADPLAPLVSFGAATDVFGAADNVVVSLGDGGSIVVGFTEPIGNGPGDDFAVFENGIFEDGTGAFYGELAFVDVSSDGTQFARFESVSLQSDPIAGLQTIDPTDYDNLAGDQPALFGTGFDLSELGGHPLVTSGQLDLYAIRYIRLVDVIGDGSTQDLLMNPIYEPYSTPFDVGGFDLDAVGIMNVPEPSTASGLLAGLAGLIALARRRRRFGVLICLAAVTAVLALPAPAIAQYTIDFEDQGLAVGEFYDGADFAGGFDSNGATFENTFTDFGGGFTGWTGFSASAVQDIATAGFGNQYAAFDTLGTVGSGAGDSIGYGVFYGGPERIVLPTPSIVASAMLTNGTYGALSMMNGDSFAKQFGGATGDDLDWFEVTLTGFDDLDDVTGSVTFELADYRSLDNLLDYVVDEWTLVDLTPLGVVTSIGLSFDGSDQGQFGLNTPAYVGIDDINVSPIPEPGTALLVGLGLLGLARRARAS